MEDPNKITDAFNEDELNQFNAYREAYRQNRIYSGANIGSSIPSTITPQDVEQAMRAVRFVSSGHIDWDEVAKVHIDDDEEDEADDNLVLPPLVQSLHAKKTYPIKYNKILAMLDMFCNNMGSLCFVIGSVLLYPEYESVCLPYSCEWLGVVLFIVGSVFFLLGAILSAIQTRAFTSNDLALALNAALYIVADALFVIGSYYFLPRIVEALGSDEIGVILFIIGSIVFVIAPGYNLYRCFGLYRDRRITRSSFRVETLVGVLYILGSLLFVVGSVYFLPSLYAEWAVTIFVIGSSLFQLATLVPPVYRLYRYSNRRKRQMKRRANRLACVPPTEAQSLLNDMPEKPVPSMYQSFEFNCPSNQVSS